MRCRRYRYGTQQALKRRPLLEFHLLLGQLFDKQEDDKRNANVIAAKVFYGPVLPLPWNPGGA